MKIKIILLLLCVFLVSCGIPTQEEIDAQKRICEINWEELRINYENRVYCESKPKKTTTMDCIKEYTNWLDEKYNNPDNVNNLREDEYSKVVETCNKIFWENNN